MPRTIINRSQPILPLFLLCAGTFCALFYNFPACAQEVNFGQDAAPSNSAVPAATAQPTTSSTEQPPAAASDAPPEKGYSKYYNAPGVWQENEDIPPPGIDAPPEVQPPAPGDPQTSDAASPVGAGAEQLSPVQGTPPAADDPAADNGGMNSAAAAPAAVSGVGSDHPGMNG